MRVALAAALALTTAAPGFARDRAPSPQRPNIVFVLLDDLRFDAMGFLKPGLNTPNIDRLAREGVYFPNAVVTSSLCSPSRATILTGQSPRNHRVIDNTNSSEAGLTFFPSYLQQQGYQTAFIGKWHMGDASDAPRPGFDHWVSFRGQGNYCPTVQLSPQQIAAGQRNQLNVDGHAVAQQGYITDELTDYALDWLERGRDPGKPFFLYLSHKAVHSDPLTAARYLNQYRDLPIPLPDTMADTSENRRGKPMWVQNQRNSWHGVEFLYHTDRVLTEQIRDYYRTLSPVDDSLGRVMAWLRRSGQSRNTIVVFTSDNGFTWGEHGLIDKRTAYEPSVRVPLIVWAPGRFPGGQRNEALVRNLDFAPTILDLAGAPRPANFEGASFLPLATGQVAPADWNPGDFIYEYYWEWAFPQTPTTFAIERGRLKYIQYHGVWDTDELYDLASDPDERNNLTNDPAYLERKIALRQALYRQLANGKGDHVLPFTQRLGPGAVLRNVNGSHAADFPEESYVEPNLPTRANGLFPETAETMRATAEGRRYLPGEAAPAPRPAP